MAPSNDTPPGKDGEEKPKDSMFGFEGKPAFSGRPSYSFWKDDGPIIDVPQSSAPTPPIPKHPAPPKPAEFPPAIEPAPQAERPKEEHRPAHAAQPTASPTPANQGPSSQSPFWSGEENPAPAPQPKQSAPPPREVPPPPPPAPPSSSSNYHQLPSAAALVPVRPGTALDQSNSDFSYEVQEIMSKPPHWLLRSGITVIACVIGIILFLSWMIHYPDTISGKITISGTSPAIQVVAQKSGHLEKLLVQEGELVEKGQIFGVIESSTNAERVFALKENLAPLIPFLSDPSKFTAIPIGMETQLGRLQDSYSVFLTDYIAYQAMLKDDYTQKTSEILNKQLVFQNTRISNLETQVESATRSLNLVKEKYTRMEVLFGRGSLSKAELEDQERALISAENAKADIVRSLDAEKLSALDLEKQISDLKHERTETIGVSQRKLQESMKRLISEIEIWEEEYVLRAPVAGRVAFYDFWASTQYVTQGSQVFVVAPESSALVGRMQVTGSGVGKIKTGQTVNVKFVDYSYKEFGLVTGKVRSISLVAREGTHLVIVDLDYPLVTNFHKEIPFKQAMQANGEIITEDLRLLERIFYELRKAISSAMEPENSDGAAKA